MGPTLADQGYSTFSIAPCTFISAMVAYARL
jgi:hypothetical protein